MIWNEEVLIIFCILSTRSYLGEARLMGIHEIISEQISTNRVLIYMKGSPDAPQCGFSAQASQALIGCGERFSFIDILISVIIFL